jgi:acyl-CoA thioester hydrolase
VTDPTPPAEGDAGEPGAGGPAGPGAGGPGTARRATHRAQVRWSDEDKLGHVNHARYLSYFEDARMELLALSPTGVPGDPADRGCIAARVAVDYLAPVRYRSGLSLCVSTWVSRVGGSSWTMIQELSDGPATVARCEAVMVAYGYDRDRSRPLDGDERAFWQGYLG